MGDYIEKYTLNGKVYALFDYQGIQYTDVPNIVEYTSYLTEKSMYRVATERPGYHTPDPGSDYAGSFSVYDFRTNVSDGKKRNFCY